jgi:hypothetical protein
MSKRRQTTVMTISSVLLAVAPKCPICFLAYFGIFGVATTSVSAYQAWLPPVTAVWLALTIALLAFRAGRLRKYGPLGLAIAAGLSVFAGRFIIENHFILYAGMAALLVAAGWSSWSRTSAGATSSCSQCEPQPRLTEPGTQAGSGTAN